MMKFFRACFCIETGKFEFEMFFLGCSEKAIEDRKVR